jgi:tetratricopeptide (TPR) repeat protein
VAAAALAVGCAPPGEDAPDGGSDGAAAETTGGAAAGAAKHAAHGHGPARPDGWEAGTTPLLEDIGEIHRPVTTDEPRAQRYFDQGLTLHYAFNHAAAARSFREAAHLDPACAMCWWGYALTLGPNINAGMEPGAAEEAIAAMARAREASDGATPVERALVRALAARYEAPSPADRSGLDSAYAGAMMELAARFEEDADLAILAAEALMVTSPWDYWRGDGTPKPVARRFLPLLERAMALAPGNPGGNHLYIHAVEAVHPERGVEAARRLEGLVPVAGHLVHMPGHIYIRVGRYAETVEANRRAIRADSVFARRMGLAGGVYELAYVPHNHHFLWAAATMMGRGELALEAARELAAEVDTARMREEGLTTLQHYWVSPLYARARFGRWDEILALDPFAEDLVYPNAVRSYTRALALVRKDRLSAAERELGELERALEDPALERVTVWGINATGDLMAIARDVVAGELAAARGRYDEAVRHLRRGVEREDALVYDEPPPWHHPVRQVLGAVLLEAGRPVEAEEVYREDLARFPANGWSLYGLSEALEAQGREREAEEARRRFREAWARADVTLTRSTL